MRPGRAALDIRFRRPPQCRDNYLSFTQAFIRPFPDMMTIMKGALKNLRLKRRRRKLATLAPACMAQETITSTAPASSVPCEPSTVAGTVGSTTESPTAESVPRPADDPKTSASGPDVAVLTLGEAGEIVSAHDACAAVFGWEP